MSKNLFEDYLTIFFKFKKIVDKSFFQIFNYNLLFYKLKMKKFLDKIYTDNKLIDNSSDIKNYFKLLELNSTFEENLKDCNIILFNIILAISQILLSEKNSQNTIKNIQNIPDIKSEVNTEVIFL